MLEMIQLETLEKRAAADAAAFRDAKPFRHIVIDDLLLPECRETLARSFPDGDWTGWNRGRGDSDPYQPKKYTCDRTELMPAPLRELLYELNSAPVLRWLEQLTGIEGLMADPHLFGGGLHSSGPGGKLAPHIDFHFGRNQMLHRRLNLLVYLNKDWSPENNGALELWDQRADRVAREVLPELGRTVLFQTDADSMHGFSKPLVGRFRNSVALYYYTVAPPPRYSGDLATHWRLETNGAANGRSSAWQRMQQRALLFAARCIGAVAFRLTNASHKVESLAGRHPW